MRDFEVKPYSPDEQRVADYIVERTQGNIGAGDDPIGFLITCHSLLIEERNLLQATLRGERPWAYATLVQTGRITPRDTDNAGVIK